MVLLLTLKCLYQESFREVDLKHRGRDVSEGSLVSCCSKDDMAGDEPLPSKSTNQITLLIGFNNHKLNKEKCSSVVDDRSLHSHEMFMAVKGPKPDTIFRKVL